MNNADMPAMPAYDRFRLTVDGKPMHGLTKREHFAGLAMQGLLSEENSIAQTKTDAAEILGIDPENYDWKTHWPQLVAKVSVQHADALLAELEKSK